MIDYPSSGCKYLDARLTFRRATSNGLLEICDKEEQWSVACADNQISQGTLTVICNQLGYEPLSRSLRIPATPVLINGRPFNSIPTTEGLACRGSEANLAACIPKSPVEPSTTTPVPGRRKRGSTMIRPIGEESTGCRLLSEIQCGG